MTDASSARLESKAYRLEARVEDRQIHLLLTDLASGFAVADGPYSYSAIRACPEGRIVSEWLLGPTIGIEGSTIRITGILAGLEVTHALHLPVDGAFLEERITLRNKGSETVRLLDFSCGFTRRIADSLGAVLPELQKDRLAAVPLRHRAADTPGFDMDFSLADLLRLSGRDMRPTEAPLAWPHYTRFKCPWHGRANRPARGRRTRQRKEALAVCCAHMPSCLRSQLPCEPRGFSPGRNTGHIMAIVRQRVGLLLPHRGPRVARDAENVSLEMLACQALGAKSILPFARL